MTETTLKKKYGQVEIKITVSDVLFKYSSDSEIADWYKIDLELVRELRIEYDKKGLSQQLPNDTISKQAVREVYNVIQWNLKNYLAEGGKTSDDYYEGMEVAKEIFEKHLLGSEKEEDDGGLKIAHDYITGKTDVEPEIIQPKKTEDKGGKR